MLGWNAQADICAIRTYHVTIMPKRMHMARENLQLEKLNGTLRVHDARFFAGNNLTTNTIDSHSAKDGLGYCLSRAAMLIQNGVDEALVEVDLSRLSWIILACIHFDGIQSPSQIARFVGLERTAASRLISRLEELGYVKRETDSDDGRGYRVIPTRRGIVVCNKAPSLIQSGMRPYLTDLSENDVQQLIGLLKRVGSDIEAIWNADNVKLGSRIGNSRQKDPLK